MAFLALKVWIDTPQNKGQRATHSASMSISTLVCLVFTTDVRNKIPEDNDPTVIIRDGLLEICLQNSLQMNMQMLY